MSETQAKLEQLEKDIHEVEKTACKMNNDFVDLKAKLADEQKPKLRHGDYGFGKSKEPYLMTSTVGNNFGFLVNVPHTYGDAARYKVVSNLGNIFDDLKAIAEPLDKSGFELPFVAKNDNAIDIRVKIEYGYVKFQDTASSGNSWVNMEVENLHTFILNLRRLEAGMK